MDGSHNPYLKKAILEAVENQIKDNNPPETKKTLDRLIKNGYLAEFYKRRLKHMGGPETVQETLFDDLFPEFQSNSLCPHSLHISEPSLNSFNK